MTDTAAIVPTAIEGRLTELRGLRKPASTADTKAANEAFARVAKIEEDIARLLGHIANPGNPSGSHPIWEGKIAILREQIGAEYDALLVKLDLQVALRQHGLF